MLECAKTRLFTAMLRENMVILPLPSDNTMMNGATVEVTNTDAEGRPIMADALALAPSWSQRPWGHGHPDPRHRGCSVRGVLLFCGMNHCVTDGTLRR